MGHLPYSEEDARMVAAEEEQATNEEFRHLLAYRPPMFNGYVARMHQEQLHRGIDVDDMTQWRLADYMRSMALGLLTEAAELVESFQWKPWKVAWDEGFPVDKEETLGEVCDVLHFLGHLCYLAEISDEDLCRGMAEGIRKNRARQDGEYQYEAPR